MRARMSTDLRRPTSDSGTAATAVIVNRAFVEQVLGGRNALGRRMRYTWRYGPERAPRTGEAADSARWYEIVGVVSDMLVVGVDPGESEARLYHPLTPGQLHPVSLALRLRSGSPVDYAPRLRELTATVDPTLQLHDILPLDESLRQKQRLQRFLGLAIALVTLSVVLLSAAGIHALMAFTVARRRGAHADRGPTRGARTGAAGTACPADGGAPGGVGRRAHGAPGCPPPIDSSPENGPAY
jgi:putative ABC transport system permease protein